MNKRALVLSARGLLIASLPLAVAVGCATGESQPPSTDKVSVQQSMPESDFSFETYMSRIDEPRTPEAAPEPETETVESAPEVTPDVASANEGETNIEGPDAAVIEAEPMETFVEPSTPRPAAQVVYFGFDQSEVDAEDRALLEQHAQYLLQNPRTSIVISGHADNRGPEAYNQHLSELRAKRVAGVLMDLGVPENRITIQGLGAGEPAGDPQRWHENRRVEIQYEDSYLVMSP
jgi:peptidoglycan-associated lipoprotein